MHRVVLTGLVALGMAACRGSEPTVIGASVASPNPAHLTDPVTITISVNNVSGKTIAVPDPQTAGCPHFFSIVDESGRAAQFEPRACPLVLTPPIELRPGEAVTYIEDWIPSSATINGAPLTPGGYSVRHANLGALRFGSWASVMLQLIQ